MSFRPAVLALAVVALFGAAVPAAAKPAKAAKPALEGLWDTAGGRVEIERLGDKVTGILTGPADGSPLDAGLIVLRGTFFEDNFTGEVRLGLVARPCGAVDKQGFSMLLLTRSGKLTGSLATKDPCAVGVQSVLFTRAPEQGEAAKKESLASAPVPPDFGLYEDTAAPRTKKDTAIGQLLAEGMELAQAGQYEKGRKLFLKATEQQPNRGEAYNGVGMTYALRNDYDAAIEWYKKGLENAPGFSDLYFNLACSYAQSGKKAMALRYLRLSATKGFAQPEMMDDPDLEPLRGEAEFNEIKQVMASVPASPLRR